MNDSKRITKLEADSKLAERREQFEAHARLLGKIEERIEDLQQGIRAVSAGYYSEVVSNPDEASRTIERWLDEIQQLEARAADTVKQMDKLAYNR